jgi:ketosteroid isomerase-like protein
LVGGNIVGYDAAMMSMAAMQAVVMRYFACLNTEDWDGMRELWCEDGELRAVGARPRSGREDVVGYFSKLFKPWPRHDDQPTRVLAFEPAPAVLAEVRFTGLTADHREVRFDAVDVFDFRQGRIRALSNWYDIDYVRRELTRPHQNAGDAQPASRTVGPTPPGGKL